MSAGHLRRVLLIRGVAAMVYLAVLFFLLLVVSWWMVYGLRSWGVRHGRGLKTPAWIVCAGVGCTAGALQLFLVRRRKGVK